MGQVGTLFFFNFEILFMAFLCVSQQGEFKNTIKNFCGEIHAKNFWPKKVEKKKLFSCRLFPPIFFYRVFGRFSAYDDPQKKGRQRGKKKNLEVGLMQGEWGCRCSAY
jgi:hypothetical protein